MDYDAEHDKNLARYFSNPARQRHIQRAKLLERLDRTPSFYRHLMSLCRTEAVASEPCLCSPSFVCVFCTAKQRRADILNGGPVLSPLRILLQEIAPAVPHKRPQSRTQGTHSRPQSASGRPASSDLRHSSTPTPRPPSSSTPRPPSALIPSRPNSAAAQAAGPAPPSRPTSAADSDRLELHAAEFHHDPAVRSESTTKRPANNLAVISGDGNTVSKRSGRRPKVVQRAASSKSRHVHFDSPVKENSVAQDKRSMDELTLLELLEADPHVFDACDGGVSSGEGQVTRKVLEKLSTKLKTGTGKDETVRVEVAPPVTQHSSPATTFLMIRFTAKQFAAATTIQAAFRGHTVRRLLKRRKRAARIIQRAVRSFLESRRTAVAVWTLERHGGRWCPTSKFTQIANSHTLMRPPSLASSQVIPGESRAIHAHEQDVVRLSAMISVLCSESKDRVSLLTEWYEHFCAIVFLWVPQSEKNSRRDVEQDEAAGRAALRQQFVLEARYASQRKTLLYRHEAARSDLLREHRGLIFSICSQLVAVAEIGTRVNIAHQEDENRNALLRTALSSRFSSQKNAVVSDEILCREQLQREYRNTCVFLWENFALRVYVDFMSRLIIEESAERSALIVSETAQRIIAAFV